MNDGHWPLDKPKMRSPASVVPEASEDYSYRVAGSSASRKKKGHRLV